MERLSRATMPAGRVLGAAADADSSPIVHLGLGNFHRAHQAVATARALPTSGTEWGILGVARSSRTVVDAMRAQDDLYSLVELGGDGAAAHIVDVHRGTLIAESDGPRVTGIICDSRTRLVTLTLTEKGYYRDPRTGHLDLDHPDVRHDLQAPHLAKLPLSQLALGLACRASGQAPLAILSCDTLHNAGEATRTVILDFLKASRASDATLSWVAEEVAFPDSMVDRIVPVTTDETRATAARLLGVRDEVPVATEDYSMWVLQDAFPGGRPRWEDAGAIFSDEVSRYEALKLRVLNGSQSLMAYLGALDGRATIPEARAQDWIADCVRRLIRDEYLPSLTLPTDFDVDAYVESLFQRWTNRALGDQVRRVGSDGSVKLLQRVPDAALRILGRGRVPHQLSLLVAAWICCVCPPAGFDPGPVAASMAEPLHDELARVTAGVTSPQDHCRAIIEGGFLPDAMANFSSFTRRVGELARIITTDGPQAAAREALTA